MNENPVGFIYEISASLILSTTRWRLLLNRYTSKIVNNFTILWIKLKKVLLEELLADDFALVKEHRECGKAFYDLTVTKHGGRYLFSKLPIISSST